MSALPKPPPGSRSEAAPPLEIETAGKSDIDICPSESARVSGRGYGSACTGDATRYHRLHGKATVNPMGQDPSPEKPPEARLRESCDIGQTALLDGHPRGGRRGYGPPTTSGHSTD